jgi:hypothetical protein
MAGKEESGSFVMPYFSNHAFRDFDPDNFVEHGIDNLHGHHDANPGSGCCLDHECPSVTGIAGSRDSGRTRPAAATSQAQ